MITIQQLAISLTLLLVACSGPSGSWNDNRVILISIDGFRGDMLDDPNFESTYPNLHRLRSDGESCSQVKTVFPSLTYPAHTSMVTGVLPKQHGIINNRPFVPTNNFVDWFWYYDSIKTPSIISKAKENGLVTLGVSWPVTVGAPIDWLLPEIKSVTDTISTIDLVRQHDVPATFLESAKIRGVVPEDGNPTGFNRDILLHEIFLDGFKRKAPHLSLYHMIETDLVQHKHGKHSSQAKEAFMFMDSLVGNIISYLDEEKLWETTSIIITGDHGFRDYHTQVSVNRLFEKHGWLTIQGGKIFDWDVVCLASGGSGFVRLKESSTLEFKKKVRLVLSKQTAFEVFERRHMVGDLWAPDETDFLLLAKKGYGFVRNIEQPYMLEKAGGSHGGDPNHSYLKTGFIAAGRGIKKGQLDSLRITDIAFKISDLLDLGLK